MNLEKYYSKKISSYIEKGVSVRAVRTVTISRTRKTYFRCIAKLS